MSAQPLVLALIAAVLAAAPAAACDAEKTQAQGAAQRAWVDPQTGELGAPPAGAEPPADEGGGGAEEPLVVEPGKTEAGGIMVDLRGRRMYSIEATLTPTGEVVTDCVRQQE